MTDVIYPDEILSPTEGFGAADDEALPTSTEELKKQIDELAKRGKLKIGGDKAVPIFVLGFVGGALGSNLLKGGTGMLIGGGLAWWAYKKLSE